jgi:hypothetical protein
MTLGELGAYVCTHLRRHGIDVVLSGGACVSVYTENRYESLDLDFIEPIRSTPLRRLGQILAEIGFERQNRYFRHPQTRYFVEFPPGPVTVGDEPVGKITTMSLATGELVLISPTDCVKDRLAGYYHWNDRQCLEQAVLVAQSTRVNLAEMGRWSAREGKAVEFRAIRPRLARRKKSKRRRRSHGVQ